MTGAGAAWCQSTESFDCLLQAEHDKLTTTGIKLHPQDVQGPVIWQVYFKNPTLLIRAKYIAEAFIKMMQTEPNLSSLLQSAEMN